MDVALVPAQMTPVHGLFWSGARAHTEILHHTLCNVWYKALALQTANLRLTILLCVPLNHRVRNEEVCDGMKNTEMIARDQSEDSMSKQVVR